MEWRDFERDVASIFRVLGADVEHDVAVAGNQIDVLVRERTASGRQVTTVVECKAFERPVGVAEVNALAGLHALFKQRGLADAAMLVSKAGFTKQAREAGTSHGIDLVEFDDLRQRVAGRTPALAAAASEVRIEDERRAMPPRQPRAFVAMPFDQVFAVGAAGDRPDLVVEALDPAVAQAGGDEGEDAFQQGTRRFHAHLSATSGAAPTSAVIVENLPCVPALTHPLEGQASRKDFLARLDDESWRREKLWRR